jgi:hypothetical protein
MPPSLDETESVAVIIVDDNKERQSLRRDRICRRRTSVAVGNSAGNFRASSHLLRTGEAGTAVQSRCAAPVNTTTEDTPMMNTSLEYLSYSLETLEVCFYKIPGSQVLARYVKSSHQNDPGRTLLEVILLIFAIRTLLQSRTRADGSGKHFIQFSEKVHICFLPLSYLAP